MAGARRPTFALDLPGLGPFGSVNLVPDVVAVPDQERARSLAAAWTEPFRAAGAAALAEPEVADPDSTGGRPASGRSQP